MPVTSRTSPDGGGGGLKSGLVSAKTMATTSGGVAVDWTTGWKKVGAADGPSLAGSVLRRLVIRNTSHQHYILVALDTTGEFFTVAPYGSVEIALFDTTAGVTLKDGAGTGTSVYLEAHYDEVVS